MGDRFFKLAMMLIGLGIWVASAMTLENVTGISVDTTYKVTCAIVCVGFMAHVATNYPGERWPWIAVAVACLFNAGLFFTPVLGHPASRGEIMLFALPDVSIFTLARAVTYPAEDVHERAVRQQIFMGLFFAVALGAIILATGFIPDRREPSAARRMEERSGTP